MGFLYFALACSRSGMFFFSLRLLIAIRLNIYLSIRISQNANESFRFAFEGSSHKVAVEKRFLFWYLLENIYLSLFVFLAFDAVLSSVWVSIL